MTSVAEQPVVAAPPRSTSAVAASIRPAHAGMHRRRCGRLRAVPARAVGLRGAAAADDRIRGQRQLLRPPGQGAVSRPPRRAARQSRHRGVRRRRAPLHVLRAVPGTVADADPAPHRPPRRQADGAVDARRLVRAGRCADRARAPRPRSAARRCAGRAIRGDRARRGHRHGHRRLDRRLPGLATVGVPRGVHLEHRVDGGHGGEPDRRLGRPERPARRRSRGRWHWR